MSAICGYSDTYRSRNQTGVCGPIATIVVLAGLALAAYGAFILSQRNPYTYSQGISFVSGGLSGAVAISLLAICCCSGSSGRTLHHQSSDFHFQRGRRERQSVPVWSQEGAVGEQVMGPIGGLPVVPPQALPYYTPPQGGGQMPAIYDTTAAGFQPRGYRQGLNQTVPGVYTQAPQGVPIGQPPFPPLRGSAPYQSGQTSTQGQQQTASAMPLRAPVRHPSGLGEPPAYTPPLRPLAPITPSAPPLPSQPPKH